MQETDSSQGAGAPIAKPEIGAAPAPGKTKPKWDPKGKRNIFIVGGVVGTAGLMLLGLSLSGRSEHNHEPSRPSSATQAQAYQVVPGGVVVSQSDRDALIKADDARLEAARQQGQSAMGNPIPTNSMSLMPNPAQGAAGQPVVQAAAPQLQPQPQPQAQPQPQPQPQAQAQADQAKLQGLEKQMGMMMSAWGYGDSQAGKGPSSYVRTSQRAQAQSPAQGQGQAAGSNAGQQNHDGDPIVVSSYDQSYGAETLGPIDTDTPGKLRARILTGPLTGAVVVGTARRIGTQGVQFDFTTASFKGKAVKVSAYGVDMQDSGDVVRGDYDARIMQRFVFPVLADGLKAYAGARAQTGTQVIAINVPGSAYGATGATQVPVPSAEQAREAMYSAGAGQVGQILKSGPQDGHITLDVRTQFGIVFEQPVYRSDIEGTPIKAQ